MPFESAAGSSNRSYSKHCFRLVNQRYHGLSTVLMQIDTLLSLFCILSLNFFKDLPDAASDFLFPIHVELIHLFFFSLQDLIENFIQVDLRCSSVHLYLIPDLLSFSIYKLYPDFSRCCHLLELIHRVLMLSLQPLA